MHQVEIQNNVETNPILFNPYLLEGVFEDTNILDLTEDQIGILAGFQDSISEIPNKILPIFIKTMSHVYSQWETNPNNILFCKQVFLFMIATLIRPATYPNDKQSFIFDHCNLILNGNWTKFTIGYFAKKNEIFLQIIMIIIITWQYKQPRNTQK